MHRALAATLILITAAGILIHHKDIPLILPIAHQPPAIIKSSSSFRSTTLTDYLAITKTALTAQVKLIGATVDREYVHVEHIQQSTFGVPTDATVIIRYAVAFAFGYDLQPSSFTLAADSQGITVTLRKPTLMAFPAVSLRAYEIPDSGFFIDEQAAVSGLLLKLPGIAQVQGKEIAADEAVIALCEQKLTGLIRDILQKALGVGSVPPIRIRYY